MKGRALLWTAVLVASHAAAYFLPGRREVAGGGGEVAALTASNGRSAKVRDRGSRQEAGSHRLLLRELSASDLPNEDFKAAREALLLDLIKRDLRSALDLFFQPDSPAVYRKMVGDSWRIEEELQREIARQPERVWDWIRSGRYGSNRVEVTEHWNTALLASGQRELVLANLSAGGPAEREDALLKLSERAMPDELAKIRGFMDETLQARDSWDELVDAYAVRLVNALDGKVDTIFTTEENSDIRTELCQRWVERELKDLPPQELVARLKGVPADLLEEVLQTVCNDAPHGKISGAVALLDELGRSGVWDKVEEATPEWMADKLVMEAYEGFMETEEVFSQLGAIQDPAQRSAALSRLGEELSDGGINSETLKVVQTLPEGAGRDDLLYGFLSDVSNVSPEWATALELIGDPDLRAELEEKQAQRESEIRKRLLEQVDQAWELADSGVDAVRRGLYLADGAYNLGKYDEAISRYEAVLRIDPYNNAARRGIEATHQAMADWARGDR